MSFCLYVLRMDGRTPKGFQVTPARFETNCFASRREAKKMCRELKERGLVKACRVTKNRRGEM